jgi:hypothetical protein
MRKPFLAALAGLLALAAAAGPAAADPARLDEAGLGGVAAGAGLTFSNQQLTSMSTSTTLNSSSVSSAAQAMRGSAANRNYATAVSARDVLAHGNSVANIRGSLAR